MYKVDSETKTIEISRGDRATLTVTANNGEYEFKTGDILRLRIYKKKDYTEMLKEIVKEVASDTTEVNLDLSKEDTIIGEDISKPVTYWYEISLNEIATIIGYDDDGPKEFIIYPAEKGE